MTVLIQLEPRGEPAADTWPREIVTSLNFALELEVSGHRPRQRVPEGKPAAGVTAQTERRR